MEVCRRPAVPVVALLTLAATASAQDPTPREFGRELAKGEPVVGLYRSQDAGATWTALPSVCRDAPDCNVAGTRALGAGRMDDAEAAFEAQARFAWCEGDDAQVVLAHNNLALLALRRDRPLRARLWTDVALRHDPRSRAALHNARLADERVARLPAAQGVTGTYWSRWGAPRGHDVEVQELPGKRLRFALQATAARSCSSESRMGGAFGIVPLTGRVAVWETREWGEPCGLRFRFGPDELTIEQDGTDVDCGFGGGVHADGRYRRISRKPPAFEPGGTLTPDASR